MRINIYEEELILNNSGVTVVKKTVPQGKGVPETFYGVRFWMESPQTILDHSTPEDDDRSAVTLWVREENLPHLRDLLLDAGHKTMDLA